MITVDNPRQGAPEDEPLWCSRCDAEVAYNGSCLCDYPTEEELAAEERWEEDMDEKR